MRDADETNCRPRAQ
ncbi:MAG: hypothetical protein F4109_00595 [Gammaproteobacteria bacterium]|nr:hypothetical protein [Gammaproteobacteria bacterium]MYD01069.1 hypothetical protein [Gammaproteobacteria bacterium]MYI23923.1 hypothetical protein [Gammaproteobacteria bacterium]